MVVARVFGMVSYILNVSFSSKNMHTICNRVFSAEDVEEKEVQDFMHELIYFDLLKRFENILWEVHIRFEPTQEQLDRFYELIEKCSYTQCLYLFKKVSEWYIVNITKGKVFKSKAPSQVLASVVNFYENAMNKGWEVYRRAPESASELMHFVIKKILKKDMSILDNVI